MEKSIFEKRYEKNYKNYIKLSKEELKQLEKNTIEEIYKNLSLKEIICAELEIIEEDLKNEITIKQNEINNTEYTNYLNIIKKIRKIIESIPIDNNTKNEIKQIITILQLSLNIEPSFTTTIKENDKTLHDMLENYIEKELKKEKKWKI